MWHVLPERYGCPYHGEWEQREQPAQVLHAPSVACAIALACAALTYASQ